MKEILSVDYDAELDMTEVGLRVPDFKNFGDRLNELERAASEANAEVEPTETEIEALTNHMSSVFDASMDAVQKRLDSMEEGPEKESLKIAVEQLKSMAVELDDDMDGSEDDEDFEDSADLNDEESDDDYSPQELRVSLLEGVKWDNDAEARVDQFLQKWPSIRPKVLQAAFEYYKDNYPEIKEFYSDDPGAQFILPEPNSPEVIEDLFCICTIYPLEDNNIGLGGGCTWGEEHGFGVLLDSNFDVVECGHESVAFG